MSVFPVLYLTTSGAIEHGSTVTACLVGLPTQQITTFALFRVMRSVTCSNHFMRVQPQIAELGAGCYQGIATNGLAQFQS